MAPLAKLRIVPYQEDNSLVDSAVGSVAGSAANQEGSFGYTVQINPNSLNFSHAIEYKQDQAPGTSGAAPDYIRSKPVTLEFEVTFDRTGAVQAGDALGNELALVSAQGVDMDINTLKKAILEYDGEIHRPKKVKIYWGPSFQMPSQLAFAWQLSNFSYTYKKFNSFGIPLRATVGLTFQGVLEDKVRIQIEKSNSPDITRLVTVKEGDTLPLLAHKAYGDSKYYIAVMKANGIVHFRDLQPGQKIVFPPIE